MKRMGGAALVIVVVCCLAVTAAPARARAHGPEGSVYLSWGGFTFGSGRHGASFFGIDSGSGFSLWAGTPYRRPYYAPRPHYRHPRHRRPFFGPPLPAGVIVIVPGGGHGRYDRAYGDPYRHRSARTSRVWVPGRSTAGGYVQGYWAVRPW